MRIGKYKLWFNKGWHCMGFCGKVGRPKQVEPIFRLPIGGFTNYWLWRITLTVFDKEKK